VRNGIVNLSEFDQKLGHTRIHNSLIVQYSGYWPGEKISPIRLKLTIPGNRIGHTRLHAARWILRLAMLNLEDLSEGDKKNIAYEIAYMAILGPGESSTNSPFKQLVRNPKKEWEQKIVKDHTIPSDREIKAMQGFFEVAIHKAVGKEKVAIPLAPIILHIIPNQLSGKSLFTVEYGQMKDGLYFHLAFLLHEFGQRIKKCSAKDCPHPFFIPQRRTKKFCSLQCQTRVGIQKHRQKTKT